MIGGTIAIGFWIGVFLLGVWGVYETWVDYRAGQSQQKEKGHAGPSDTDSS